MNSQHADFSLKTYSHLDCHNFVRSQQVLSQIQLVLRERVSWQEFLQSQRLGRFPSTALKKQPIITLRDFAARLRLCLKTSVAGQKEIDCGRSICLSTGFARLCRHGIRANLVGGRPVGGSQTGPDGDGGILGFRVDLRRNSATARRRTSPARS